MNTKPVTAPARPAAAPAPAAKPAAVTKGTYTLLHAVVAEDGTETIAAGTVLKLQRPKARHMIKIAHALPKIARVTEQVRDIMARHEKAEEAAPEIMPLMTGEVFEAMVAVAGALSGIGEAAAMDLDTEDLQGLAMEALAVQGE